MIRRELEAAVTRYSDHVVAGTHRAMLGDFVPMLPVYFEGRAHLVDGPEQLAELLDALHARLREAGIDRAAARITAAEDVAGGRFRLTVESRYFAGAAEWPRTTVIVYYCTETAGRARVAMVEYRRAAFPDIDAWNRFNPGFPYETARQAKIGARH